MFNSLKGKVKQNYIKVKTTKNIGHKNLFWFCNNSMPDTLTATSPQEQTAIEGQTEVDPASEHVEVRADLQL